MTNPSHHTVDYQGLVADAGMFDEKDGLLYRFDWPYLPEDLVTLCSLRRNRLPAEPALSTVE